MFRILEREKQATAEGSGDVESSNEIPYELAQFEIHLRQPVKIHNIRKRMQQEQQASVSSENGKRYFYCTCTIYKRIFYPIFEAIPVVIDRFLENYVLMYVWLVFKSGLYSRTGYIGVCTVLD